MSNHIKRLMGLTIVIVMRCDGCIDTYLRGALKAGATRDEILEAMGVVILMGGVPVMAYGSEALDALNQRHRASTGHRQRVRYDASLQSGDDRSV